MLNSNEIRKKFITFFEEKGHKVMKNASLVPDNDPTLLWVNAGITPLKKYFDGSEIPNNRRIVSVQKCIRTNDIENVGKTARHHTFFEMLGNFSIGDYFKEEAINYAYELLFSNNYFGFKKEKIFVTVYSNDEETYNIWKNKGIDVSHIIKLENNYWEIGEGPCGPDTEIFYDRGQEYDPDNQGIKLLQQEIENDRYIEIWNNVFSQFNAKIGKKREEYKELPSKNIDTGMGLERMACIIQGTSTNFETDLFLPIIKKIAELSNKKYNGDMSFKVIADHIRAITFALNDGAFFSNEGRGYVLRRLLRRGVRYGKKLGIKKPFMYELVDSVIAIMKEAYPELNNNNELIKDLIIKEEKLFHKTLSSGEKKLNELTQNNQTKTISGEDAFKLYDTYGFPFELTVEILNEKGFCVSLDEFNEYMNKQKEQARCARKSEASMNIQNEAFLKFEQSSMFVGYNNLKCDAEIIGLINGDKQVFELVDKGYVILNKTPFYAEAGGQVSDYGIIKGENFEAKVTEVIKGPNKQHIHFVQITKGLIKSNDKVEAYVDESRRLGISKNHTATHLLQYVLKQKLSDKISQSGSKVDEKSLRFDFIYSSNISDEDIIFIENKVNELIDTNEVISIREMRLEEAIKTGATALFEEKYEDIVRTVKIGNSFELCGGTHVQSLSQIKKFAIKGIESKGMNIYRIEASTDNNIGEELLKVIQPYINETKKLLNKATNIIKKASTENINLEFNYETNYLNPFTYKDIVFVRNEVERIKNEVKSLEKEYSELKQKQLLSNISYFDKFIKRSNTSDYIILKLKEYDIQTLKQLVDKLVDKLDNSFVFIANINNNSVNFISKCNKSIINKVNCGEFIKYASNIVGGNGGGSNFFGQGGGVDASKTDQILKEIEEKIIKSL